MKAAMLFFIMMTGCVVDAIAQLPAKNIEDSLALEIRKDLIVQGHVSNLKSLRKRLDSMGAKHPSRSQFEERVKSEEELLRKRVIALSAPIARDSKDSVDSTKKLQAGTEEESVESTKSARSESDASGEVIEMHQDRSDPRRKVEEGKIIDQDGLIEQVTQHEDIELIHADLAYPWIDTRRLNSIGFFHGTNRIWAVEALNSEDGDFHSSVIWEWEDYYRVNERQEFCRIAKRILSFHPSPDFQSDGLWFAIYANPEPTKVDEVEVWINRLSQPGRRRLQSNCICKFKVPQSVEFNKVFFDPHTRQLCFGVRGEIELTQQIPAVIVDLYPNRGVVINLDRWIDGGVTDANLVTLRKPINTSNDAILASLHIENASSNSRRLVPFWRKNGPEPSEAPKWWRARGKRTLRFGYSMGLSQEENADALSISISKLLPGDLLLISPGVYSFKNRLDLKLIGTEQYPIVIQGDGAGVVFTRGDTSENVINVIDTEYAAIGCLEVTGGSSGIKIQTVSNFMVYNCTIHDVGNVGVALNSRSTSSIYIIDNEIFGTSGNGEGIYAGSTDGTRKTNGSFFVGNYIHDLACGPDNQGDGIEIKNRSFNNTVKWNYITGTKYPGITVYSVGETNNPINRIIENVVIDSLDSGIQANSDALIQGNWISGPMPGVSSKPFGKLLPKNLAILGNTILSDSNAIKAKEWNRSDILIANNFLYSKTRNYFHSGFGKALYFSNQLACELPDGDELSVILQNVSNRLVAKNDILGIARDDPTTIGAIDYYPRKNTPTRSETKQQNIPGVFFKFATFEPSLSRLCLYEGLSKAPVLQLTCKTLDQDLVQCDRALLYVSKVASAQTSATSHEHRVCIIDPLNGFVYDSVIEDNLGKSTLMMKKKQLSRRGFSESSFSSDSRIVLVHPSGLYSLSSSRNNKSH